MAEDSDKGRTVVSVRAMEIATALVIIAFAALVMVGSYELGAGWDRNGPESGYFPFYIGVVMLISGATILVGEIVKGRAAVRRSFVESRSLFRVMQVLVPTTIYIALIGYIGIYVATALFVTFFMVWLGRYRVVAAVAIGTGIALALFFTFEVWFLVPLPKGPLEAWLGY